MLGFGPPNRFPLGENFRGGLTGSLTLTLDAATISAAGTVALKATLTKTLDDAALAATGAIAIKAAASVTADDAILSSSAAIALKGALSATLADATLAATGAIALKAAVTVTLGDVTYVITGGPETTITDTEVLPLPINCVLAGQQPYKFSGREWEIPAYRRSTKTAVSRSGVAKLRGGKPSFTVSTNSRGYD